MNKLQRILIAVEPGKDGVFAVVRDLVRFLHCEHPEVDVDLAYSSRRQLGAADVLAAEVRAHGGETVDLEVSNTPEFGDLRALSRIRRLVAHRRPQIIHCHSSKAGALVRISAMLGNSPRVIYTPHAYFGAGRQGGIKEAVYNSVERMLGGVGITACCSRDEKTFAEEALHLDPARLVVVNNGVKTDLFTPSTEEERAALRAKLGIPPDGRLLITIGRDSRQKNYDPLYDAVGAQIDCGVDFRFAHAGEGSVQRREKMAESVRGRVHAFNYLESPHELKRAADGFILTSLYEGLSLSMLGALACGTRLILTDAPGIHTIQGMGFDSIRWLPNPVDPGFSIASIERAIRDWASGDVSADMSQRTLACEHFDQHRQFEKIFELYREIA